MEMDQGLGEHMDRETCYAWGNLFELPWERRVDGMRSRAAQAGLVQEDGDGCLIWKKGEEVGVRFLFVDDPSDIESIRRIYNDEANVQAPVCFIVVRQPDPTDKRGDIVFDIFRMSPQSYLWHFYRVFTPPEGSR